MLADRLDLSPDTTRRVLTSEDLARIEGYVGPAGDLHALLPAVLPLLRPCWYEVTVTAQRGTVITLGYLAEPHADGIAISLAASAAGYDWIKRLDPVVVTASGMHQPVGMPQEDWREIRAAAGIVLRAILMRL